MAFQQYTGPVTVQNNCRVVAKNTKYGFSRIADREIKNIVKQPVISHTVAINKESSIVVINYSNEPNKKYKIDTGEWFDFVGTSMTVYKNCTVYAKSINAFGVESNVVSKVISELFHEAPVISSTLSIDKSFFNVNITYSDTSTNKLYKIDNGSWQAYTGTITLYNNCTIYAKGSNSTGLESAEVSKTLSGIIIDVPVITVIFNTKKTVATVSIDYKNLSVRYYSYDNINWLSYNGPIEITENCIIYAKGKALSGADSSLVSKVITEIVLSKDWISISPPNTKRLYSVAFGNGVFVIVGDMIILRSTDGFNWQQGTTGYPSVTLYSVCFYKDKFIAVGRDGWNSVIMSSSTGEWWDMIKTYDRSMYPFEICAGSNSAICLTYPTSLGNTIGTSVMSPILKTTDGNNWSEYNRNHTYFQDYDGLKRLSFGNGVFVDDSRYLPSSCDIITSSDGITWTQRTILLELGFRCNFANNMFFASSGINLYTSTNGINWTKRPDMPKSCTLIGYGDGVYVAISLTSDAMISTNGINWTLDDKPQDMPEITYWRNIAFGNGVFVAIGYGNETSKILSKRK